MLSTLKKIGLIVFVIWHMFAVSVYSIPRDAKDMYATWSRQVLLPKVTPYMLITSQWQLWNLFSPDPLRRVTFYRIETETNGDWYELTTIQPGTFSAWRHATWFKLLGNIWNEFDEPKSPLAGRMLHLLCKEHNVQEHTPIRLVYEYYVIPQHQKRESATWWNAWKPQTSSYIGFTTECPAW